MPHRPPPGVFIQTPVAEEEAAADLRVYTIISSIFGVEKIEAQRR